MLKLFSDTNTFLLHVLGRTDTLRVVTGSHGSDFWSSFNKLKQREINCPDLVIIRPILKYSVVFMLRILMKYCWATKKEKR